MVFASRSLGCFAVLIASALVMVACPPSPPPESSPGPEPAGRAPELCEPTCQRWAAMGCEEGKPVCERMVEGTKECTREVSCVEWCTDVETNGPQPLNLQCFSTAEATTCHALEDACSY